MNLPPRQQQILELVRDRGYVSIEEMAQLFVVTPQTIRRDINQLAELDLLRRYHGGAAYDSSVENTAYAMRADQMRDEKQRIAEAVAHAASALFRIVVVDVADPIRPGLGGQRSQTALQELRPLIGRGPDVDEAAHDVFS